LYEERRITQQYDYTKNFANHFENGRLSRKLLNKNRTTIITIKKRE